MCDARVMTRGMRAHVIEIRHGVDGARGRTRGGVSADADAGLRVGVGARAGRGACRGDACGAM